MKQVSIAEYLKREESKPVLDVRSPGEYRKGHIPMAKNLPLFDNKERAIVGTLYKEKGPQSAVLKGLEIAGVKMPNYILQAQELIEGKSVALHCWRGGKRSKSLATLLAFVGYEVEVIEGGYKAFRQHVLREFFNKKLELIVVGGKTGSGKTAMLQALKEKGEQVLDLEGLAHHRGSSFGSLGMEKQPTSEQFENNLFAEFQHVDPNRRVWVENESRSIGQVYIPQGFWNQMEVSTLIEVEVPFEHRLNRLLNEYGHFPHEDLMNCLDKITKRMGGQNVKAAKEAYAKGDLQTAVTLTLEYYDRSYAHSSAKKSFSERLSLKTESDDCGEIAVKLIELANEKELASPVF